MTHQLVRAGIVLGSLTALAAKQLGKPRKDRMNISVILLILTCLSYSGADAAAHPADPGPGEAPEKLGGLPPPPEEPGSVHEKPSASRFDPYGDALPPGAVARRRGGAVGRSRPVGDGALGGPGAPLSRPAGAEPEGQRGLARPGPGLAAAADHNVTHAVAAGKIQKRRHGIARVKLDHLGTQLAGLVDRGQQPALGLRWGELDRRAHRRLAQLLLHRHHRDRWAPASTCCQAPRGRIHRSGRATSAPSTRSLCRPTAPGWRWPAGHRCAAKLASGTMP